MTTAAFLIVLGSACLHASWNFLLKRSGHKAAFLCGLGIVSFSIFFVPALVLALRDNIGWLGLGFGLGSALLHGVYGRTLARGYQLGDLSTVYPISRGLGPALIPLVAVLLLDESISNVAIGGIALVLVGIVIIQAEAPSLRELLRPFRSLDRPAVRVAMLTGGLITIYSLWDKTALDHLPPITLSQFGLTGHVLFLAPLALRGSGPPLLTEWRKGRASVLAAGLFAPAAYILVLTALTTSQVSYIAPVREVGIVIGTILGVALLREGFGGPRIAAAALIVAGVLTVGAAP